jgi:hypothetical protein
MKWIYILALFSVSSFADNGNRPGPIVRPVPPVNNRPVAPAPNVPIRAVPMKPEFKNVRLRGTAQRVNYTPIEFLTEPSAREDFDPQDLSPVSQRLLQSVRRDIMINRDNFNVKTYEAFIKNLRNESTEVDIEALIALIMMDIAKSQSEELRDMLAEMKKTNEAKKAMREKAQALDGALTKCALNPAVCQMRSKADLDAAVDKAKENLDSLNEMGELESLRLQMAMQRMTKLAETLSNILKKMSDTAQSIVQNIK